MSYIDGFVIPVPTARREDYRAHEAKWWPSFRAMGAQTLVVGWGEEVPPGKQTDSCAPSPRRRMKRSSSPG